jgi:hypothetical protein
MNEIITMLEILRPVLCPRTLNQLTLIVEATLAMSGRVTMLGISRWTEKGGSYRTVQRFFKEPLDWAQLRWLLIQQQLGKRFKKVFLLVADEVVDTKSGQHTHGLGIFFHPFRAKPYGGCVLSPSRCWMLNRERPIPC